MTISPGLFGAGVSYLWLLAGAVYFHMPSVEWAILENFK